MKHEYKGFTILEVLVVLLISIVIFSMLLLAQKELGKKCHALFNRYSDSNKILVTITKLNELVNCKASFMLLKKDETVNFYFRDKIFEDFGNLEWQHIAFPLNERTKLFDIDVLCTEYSMDCTNCNIQDFNLVRTMKLRCYLQKDSVDVTFLKQYDASEIEFAMHK